MAQAQQVYRHAGSVHDELVTTEQTQNMDGKLSEDLLHMRKEGREPNQPVPLDAPSWMNTTPVNLSASKAIALEAGALCDHTEDHAQTHHRESDEPGESWKHLRWSLLARDGAQSGNHLKREIDLGPLPLPVLNARVQSGIPAERCQMPGYVRRVRPFL